MRHPVELAAVYHGAAHLGGETVHVFGGGVGHDVGAPFEGTAVDGGGEGVVHNERHTVAVGYPGEFLYVEHGAAGVGDGLAEEHLCVGPERLLYLLVIGFGRHKSAVDTELFQCHAEKIVGAAVNLAAGHNVVAGLADVEHCVEVGCLAAGGEHASHTAFQRGYLGCHGIVGGILQPCIEIAVFLQVEELGHLVGVVILEGGALDDGRLDGLAVAGLVAGMYAA